MSCTSQLQTWNQPQKCNLQISHQLPPIPRASQDRVQRLLRQQMRPVSLNDIFTFCEMLLELLKLLKPSQTNITAIQQATRKQHDSKRWYEEQFGRLTSSEFGAIIKCRQYQGYMPSVCSIQFKAGCQLLPSNGASIMSPLLGNNMNTITYAIRDSKSLNVACLYLLRALLLLLQMDLCVMTMAYLKALPISVWNFQFWLSC